MNTIDQLASRNIQVVNAPFEFRVDSDEPVNVEPILIAIANSGDVGYFAECLDDCLELIATCTEQQSRAKQKSLYYFVRMLRDALQKAEMKRIITHELKALNRSTESAA